MNVAAGNLRGSAVSGGLWSLGQVVANKAFSLLGTLALMYLLVPGDYAISALALSIQSFVTFFPAFTLGDALLARAAEAEALMGTAVRLCALISAATVVMVIAAGPIAAAAYDDQAIAAACACVALRPIVELMLLAPQTRLRLRLEFRRLAVVDAVTQALATVSGIAMAWAGAGWLSLLLPQIAFTGVRALVYRRAAGPAEPSAAWIAGEWRPLLSAYALSGLGQYVHGGLLMVPPLVIGAFADNEAVGLFSMAFTLSTAINVVVAVSIGLVLQPIFARMAEDPNRQLAAFLRSCSTIAAVAMPFCLVQAVLVGPAIRTFLPSRWEGAIPMAVLLSAGQSFYFAVNPAMSLLKAQGRFKAFLVWQGLQLMVVAGAMVLAGRLGGERAGLAIVGVAGLYTVISAPIGVRLCLRDQPSPWSRSVGLFGRPFLASLLAVVPAWAGFALLGGVGRAWDIAHIAVVPLVVACIYPLALRALDPIAWNEVRHIGSVLVARFRRSGRVVEGAHRP
jgi:O-antigen/teichoic acid export membrane protein